MRITDGLDAVPASLSGSVVTVGKFFAVHLGHQALIRATRERALARSLASVVLTFDRHPGEILTPGRAFPLLTTRDERLERLGALGVDHVVLLRLDAAFMAQPPEEFARRVLLARLHMREIVASDNFRFGRGAAGTVETLGLAEAEGFDVTLIPPVVVDGAPASSSRIARCLEAGHVEAAARMLGRRYSLRGEVGRGDRIGRNLGYPTANLRVDPRRLRPADGVYAGAASWSGRRSDAAISIGVRPTLGGSDRLIEAHLLDFNGDLYGETITLEFARFLRAQQRFDNLDALRDQIARDVEAVRRAS